MKPDDLLSLMGARRGHFVFESGYHGDLWLDLDGMFAARSQLGVMIDDRQLVAACPQLPVGLFSGPMPAGDQTAMGRQRFCRLTSRFRAVGE